MLVAAFNQYVNVGSDLATSIGTTALSLLPTPNSQSFDLNDVDKHNGIEHDGSLSYVWRIPKVGWEMFLTRLHSRADAYFGDDHSFNPTVYQQTKSYFTQEIIDIPTGAKARLARMNTANITNPGFNLTSDGVDATFKETAFYLMVFGDQVKGEAPRDWVNVFFRKSLKVIDENTWHDLELTDWQRKSGFHTRKAGPVEIWKQIWPRSLRWRTGSRRLHLDCHCLLGFLCLSREQTCVRIIRRLSEASPGFIRTRASIAGWYPKITGYPDNIRILWIGVLRNTENINPCRKPIKKGIFFSFKNTW